MSQEKQRPLGIRSGRVVPVRADGSITMGLDGPELAADESDTWQIAFQPVNGIVPVSATVALIRYWIGEASFQLPAIPVTQSIQRVLVPGRKVQVDFQGAAGVGITPVSCGMSRGGQLQGPESGGAWVASGAANASSYAFPNGWPAKVYAVQANVVAFLTNNTLYVLLIDKLAALANGDAPVAGGRSNALTANNPSADFGGSFTPLVVQQNLRVALSTTPDVYTAPVGNPTFTVDFFQGIQ